ncbi:hypothetical protein NQ318_000112 [Aromia moschata]|uniref:Carboxylic ester hydrolase n=1 Tax=Aromia moschata TaxID=1265417 RepID=A0AAV8XN32_9CUCU|nr:hypothetical protein NQ318_000112 [Aromia moschata]
MLLLILLQLVLILTPVLTDVILTIPNGQIRGRKEVTASNVTFYAFQEIPYGKAPVGKLRFKAPEPAEDWEGILDATTNTKICYQEETRFPNTPTEDCLYVNVYTTVRPSFIQLHRTTSFMEQDVVVVIVNYRVGAFGFLSTGDTVIPGNYGLKDQNLALKWVQTNIKYFGGDPKKVTIFGHSAGAAAVTYLMMSKQSTGLYRAAIAQSGSALCPWAYQRHYKDIAYTLASRIDSSFNPNATSEELLQFLQSVPADQICKNANFQDMNRWFKDFWYTPVVEPEHETAFLTEEIYTSIANGAVNSVPLLIGICSEEQVSKGEFPDAFKLELQLYEDNPSFLVNENMHLTDNDTLTKAGKPLLKFIPTKHYQKIVF